MKRAKVHTYLNESVFLNAIKHKKWVRRRRSSSITTWNFKPKQIFWKIVYYSKIQCEWHEKN